MSGSKAHDSQIDADVQSHIGRQLRASYVDILSQPVPDRFLDLLAELDGRESAVGEDEQRFASRDGAR